MVMAWVQTKRSRVATDVLLGGLAFLLSAFFLWSAEKYLQLFVWYLVRNQVTAAATLSPGWLRVLCRDVALTPLVAGMLSGFTSRRFGPVSAGLAVAYWMVATLIVAQTATAGGAGAATGFALMAAGMLASAVLGAKGARVLTPRTGLWAFATAAVAGMFVIRLAHAIQPDVLRIPEGTTLSFPHWEYVAREAFELHGPYAFAGLVIAVFWRRMAVPAALCATVLTHRGLVGGPLMEFPDPFLQLARSLVAVLVFPAAGMALGRWRVCRGRREGG